MTAWETWLASLPGWGIYGLILVTTAVIYQTTFARKLPWLKSLVIYVFLALGCFLLFIMQLMGFPIIPALLITVVLILVTRIRLSITRSREVQQSEENQ